MPTRAEMASVRAANTTAIPLSLFLVARQDRSPMAERLQTAVSAAGSLLFYLVMAKGWGWI